MTLIASDVSVNFGGVEALKSMGLEIEPSKVVALIGPNGAGKTTFMNCLSGFVKPDAGDLRVDGSQNLFTLSIDERVEAGIGRSFQTPRMDPDASVEDNLKIGFYTRTRARLLSTILAFPSQRREEREIDSATGELLSRFGLYDVARLPAYRTPIWQLRLLEVARAMALAPRYLMLDEPAAGLDTHAQRLLSSHISELRTEGRGILLVEHNFEFVRGISDYVIVLHQGRKFAEGTPGEIASSESVARIYLGGNREQGK